MNTPKDHNSDHDADLLDEKISALYKQLPAEEPAADSDDLIRATARRAVNAGPQKRRFSAATQGLLATAATLMLGIGLLVQWRQEPQKLQELATTAPAPANTKDGSVRAWSEADSIDALMADDATEVEQARKENAAAEMPVTKAIAPAKPLAQTPTILRSESGHLATEAAGSAAPPLFMPAAPVPASTAAPQKKDESAADIAAEALAERQASAEPALGRMSDSAAAAQRRAEMQKQMLATEAKEEKAAAKKQVQEDELQASMRRASPASTDAISADGAAAATSKMPPSWQQAMQAGNWEQAAALLPAVQTGESIVVTVDRDLLALLAEKRKTANSRGYTPLCQPSNAGKQALLCQLLQLQAAGKPLPDDALSQLEKSGLQSGDFSYRRPALAQLLSLH